VLRQIAAGLAEIPGVQVLVGGHTDERGTLELNQQLSEQRAERVVEYLLSTQPALSRAQFTVVGHGESMPLGPELGLNRRVEFQVVNPEVLEQEVERRGQVRSAPALPDSARRDAVTPSPRKQ
jgi:outer membrane protein OmpA-like peptidoglycan-associated protein